MNYPESQIFDLSIAELFHDIGKLKISDDIINSQINFIDSQEIEKVDIVI